MVTIKHKRVSDDCLHCCLVCGVVLCGVIICGVVVCAFIVCTVVVCKAGVGGESLLCPVSWWGGRWCDIPTQRQMMARTYSHKQRDPSK